MAVRQIKSGKAAGSDNIPAEALKADVSCTDQIAALRIIKKQSIEWNSSLYINLIDYEKAFDSVDRAILWKLLRHYGMPENSYDGLNCKIVHEGQLTKSFEVKTGVSQGCLLSLFLFLLVINWVMKTSTSEGIFNTNVKTVLLYGLKLGKLRKPSSRRHWCLLTVVYAKYLGSVDRTLLATSYCEREQTRSQWTKKSGRSDGSG
ncbi:unnamed protein product [Schistosoma margrebowiei]|uniref:Reverse transcriptase domain-containing protein n=1 Tax=Schistosoma margrebowiei TaxID=48269 RepID=A0A183LFZ1_9TREM|nr:unnamed protein product [Schistosoma margrebowiei]